MEIREFCRIKWNDGMEFDVLDWTGKELMNCNAKYGWNESANMPKSMGCFEDNLMSKKHN